ncbi:unnamed protein product [Scytosiphon promiscuus]
MELEPSQLAREMDVDIGMGLGDDLGGFEGFDAMFAEPNSTTDFFKFCALEDAQQHDSATTPAFKSPPSPAGTFGQQREREFAQEGWNISGQQQIEAWPPLTCAPSNERVTPSLLPQSGGKPRARKRHDEDQAEESAFPVIKRRSSTASLANPGPSPTAEGLEKSHSFCVTAAAGGWTPATSQQQGAARLGSSQAQQQQHGARMVSPPGGAIKVNTDVTSGKIRHPRISVFMSSSSRRRSGAANSPAVSPALSNHSSNVSSAGSRSSSAALMAPAPGITGGYGRSCQLEPTMDRTASAQAQRLKGLRITMRGRSVAEKYVVEHNPAVVAMGSPHHPNSTSALLLGDDDQDDQFDEASAPTLRRASSVGALTIAGNGDILSTSPVLSSTGRIIQSCELSDRVGDGGRRRNLVCKVFGSGGGR